MFIFVGINFNIVYLFLRYLMFFLTKMQCVFFWGEGGLYKEDQVSSYLRLDMLKTQCCMYVGVQLYMHYIHWHSDFTLSLRQPSLGTHMMCTARGAPKGRALPLGPTQH